MHPADMARNLAISLEAKKDALAQRQNGDWKVSFTVQGIDMDPRLTQASMGTRFAMVLVQIGDDELPVPQRKEADPKSTLRTPVKPQPDTDKPSAGVKRDWRELQPAAQAGIRCGEPVFSAFLQESYANEWRESREPASCVRLICGITSRVELGTRHAPRVIWHQLDTEYQAWLARERVGA